MIFSFGACHEISLEAMKNDYKDMPFGKSDLIMRFTSTVKSETGASDFLITSRGKVDDCGIPVAQTPQKLRQICVLRLI